jgi:SOS-response transcriptional repressor LexA
MRTFPVPVSPAATVPRFMPIVGDVMAPLLRSGDLVAVIPMARFRGDGLYVLELMGEPVTYWCGSDFKGGIVIRPENTRYHSFTMAPAEFEAAVIGKVAATCNIIDMALLSGRA